MALLVMRAMNTPESACVLEDALTDPQVSEALKVKILRVLTQTQGAKPYPADIGGRLTHMALVDAEQLARSHQSE